MKKIVLLFAFTLLVISCSQKEEIKGKITNASPLYRMEIVDYSDISTLPIVNIGFNEKGEFSNTLNIPKDGLYLLTYGSTIGTIYLERGQTVDISGDASTFPKVMNIAGEAKPNNDFIKSFEAQYQTVASKIDVMSLMGKTEEQFVTEVRKIYDRLKEILEKEAEKTGASQGVVRFKKDDIQVKISGLLSNYEKHQKNANAKFIPSKNFEKFQKELLKYHQRKIKNLPIYREFILNDLATDFEVFAQKNQKEKASISELFAKFIKNRPDLNRITKDYLYGYILAQTEITPGNIANYDKINQSINDNISDPDIKKKLKALQIAIMGQKLGSTPRLSLTTKNGEKIRLNDIKGKPTLVTFYASWNPNISITALPALKELAHSHKDKIRFIYINLDDTKEQFEKTSNAALKDIKGENYWVEGGINAKQVQQMGIYGFRLPSYFIMDKNGKLSSKPFFNLNDPELVEALNKITGIKTTEFNNKTKTEPIP